MTDHVVRLYALALALAVFFLTWAFVAARPWPHAREEQDPRLTALERREERLRRQAVRVNRLVERRFAAYRVRLAERQREIAAVQATSVAAPAPSVTASSGSAPRTPSVGVVSLPPITSTSSS